MSRQLSTPWGLAPTGLAVGLAQACATPPSQAAIRPIGLTMAVWVPRSSRPGARRLGCALSGAEEYTTPERTSVNLRGFLLAREVYSAGIVTLRPDDFAAASASWARSISSSAGSSPSQRATPAEAVCPRGVAAAHAVEHLDRLAEPAARQDQRELDAVEPRQRRRPRAARSASARAVSLTRRSPSPSPRSMLNALMWSRSSDGDRQRRVAHGGRARARAAAPPRTRAA